MPRNRISVLVVPCWAAISLVSSFAAEGELPSHVVEFSADRIVGLFGVLRDGEPIRRTFQEEQQVIGRGTKNVPQEVRELRGRVVFPKDAGLSISLAEDNNGSIREKLKSLEVVPAASIRALFISTHVDLECLEIIAKFAQLRDLTLSDCEAVETDAGAKFLAKLKQLRYLNVGKRGDCVFGSKKLCETIRSLEALRFLWMPCEKLRDVDIAILADHPSLESILLSAQRPVLGSRTLQALQKVPRLRELAIVCREDITSLDVMGFAEVRSLEMLSITTDAPIDYEARLKARKPKCWFFFPRLSDPRER